MASLNGDNNPHFRTNQNQQRLAKFVLLAFLLSLFSLIPLFHSKTLLTYTVRYREEFLFYELPNHNANDSQPHQENVLESEPKQAMNITARPTQSAVKFRDEASDISYHVVFSTGCSIYQDWHMSWYPSWIYCTLHKTTLTTYKG